jgi:lipopolysaccharide cholinephosphotransferase
MGILYNLLHGKKLINSIKTDDIFIAIDDSLRKKIQSNLLEMYLDVLEVCKKYSIVPYLSGGSALGVVRHHGFIPWDDDLDICMTRDDYTKFTEIFEKEFGDRYHLNAPNYKGKAKTRFPKIMKDRTVFREIVDDKDEKECCLFLDIFIIENVPDSKLIRVCKGILCNMLEFIAGQVCFYEFRNDQVKQLYMRAGKANYYIRCMIGAMFSFYRGYQWNNAVDYWVRWKDNNSKYCTFPTGRKHYFGEILQRERLFPAKYMNFEGYEVPVFHNVEIYLRNLYGNYMEIPPLEKREKHFIVKCEL